MTEAPVQVPVVPRKAATVLLLREGPDGLEVLMQERHRDASTFAGALTFPGGSVDTGDAGLALRGLARTVGSDDADWAEARATALREAFEEAGILLVRAYGSEALVSSARCTALGAQIRHDVADNGSDFAEFLRQEGLELAADLLVPFAHWITPEFAPRRFDTRFFVAAAPDGQVACHDGREMVDSVWVRPSEGVLAEQRGECVLAPPTRLSLVRLAESGSVTAALAEARARPIVTICPRRTRREDGVFVTIPEAAGYGALEVQVERSLIVKAGGGKVEVPS